jgi:hypothetical protein
MRLPSLHSRKQFQPAALDRSAHQRRLRNGIAFAAVLSVLMGALIRAVPGLRTVAHRVAYGSPGGIALELASCVGYVVAFALVFPAPPRRVAVRIAWAEMGFGAVVPIGGAGGFALGGWMHHRHGVRVREIARWSLPSMYSSRGLRMPPTGRRMRRAARLR